MTLDWGVHKYGLNRSTVSDRATSNLPPFSQRRSPFFLRQRCCRRRAHLPRPPLESRALGPVRSVKLGGRLTSVARDCDRNHAIRTLTLSR